MEITCTNFKKLYHDVEKVIKKASFVGIDVEFLGLDPEESSLRCSLFDSPADRYQKHRASVQRFPPVQLGIAFFTAEDSGQKYKVDVYNVFLFKNGLFHHECSFSTSSLAFLESHGFDFNKLISEGVSHLNLNEQKKALAELTSTNETPRYFSDDFYSLFTNIQSVLHSRLAKIRRKTSGSEGAKDLMWEEFHILIGETGLTPLHNAFLLYKLYSTVPGVLLDITGNLLTCSPRRPSKNEIQEKKAELANIVMGELAGASEIIMAIIENRLPIVGHNCLYDLLYLYQHFVGDLPESYEMFKEVITTVFPMIIDTKILAEESKNQLSWYGIVDFRLENLSSLSESECPNRLGAFPSFEFSHGFSVTSKTRNNRYRRTTFHNAAYDALVTGQAFIKLALLISKPCGTPSPLPFRTLLYTVRPFACHIPVPLLGLPYMNLLGTDPPPRYPEEILLEALNEDGLDSIHKHLRSQFGRWRCEAKIHGSIVRLATNTDTTYRRVFNFYSFHPSFRVVSSMNPSSNSLSDGGSETSSTCSSTSNFSTPNKDYQPRPRSYSISSNDSQNSQSQFGSLTKNQDASTISNQGSPLLRCYEAMYGAGSSMLMGRIPQPHHHHHHHPLNQHTHPINQHLQPQPQPQFRPNGTIYAMGIAHPPPNNVPTQLPPHAPISTLMTAPDVTRPPPSPWHPPPPHPQSIHNTQASFPNVGQFLMFQQTPPPMMPIQQGFPPQYYPHPPPPAPPPPSIPIPPLLPPQHLCLSPQAAPMPPQSKGYFVQSASGGQTMYLSPLPSPVSYPNGNGMMNISQIYSPPNLQPPPQLYPPQCLPPQMYQSPDSMMFVQTAQRPNVLIGADGQPLTPSSNLDSWNNAVMDMDRSNAIRAKIGLIINNRFQVIQKINFGSYGTIYSAKDLKNENKLVAVKFETSNEDAHLKYEFDVYKVLSGGPRKKRKKPNGILGVPKVFWFGEDYGQRMMVMSLLGPSLENLFTYCDRNFCRQTIVKLGEEMISRLQWLHERGFVHRDLKPENFLIGIEEDERILFLIDFGLARRYRYRDGENLVHIPHRKGKNLVGTAKYASLNSHLGIELSRRDDIESFAYIMAELCCGELPWKESKNKGRYRTKQQSYNRIRNIKETVDWKVACPPLSDLFTYAKQMAFTEDPDYTKIRSIVNGILTWEGGEDLHGTSPRKIESKSLGSSVESSPEKLDDITQMTEQAGSIRLTKSDPTPSNPMIWNSSDRLKRHPGRLFRPCRWRNEDSWEYNWIIRRESSDEEKARYQALFRWAHPQNNTQIQPPPITNLV